MPIAHVNATSPDGVAVSYAVLNVTLDGVAVNSSLFYVNAVGNVSAVPPLPGGGVFNVTVAASDGRACGVPGTADVTPCMALASVPYTTVQSHTALLCGTAPVVVQSPVCFLHTTHIFDHPSRLLVTRWS